MLLAYTFRCYEDSDFPPQSKRCYLMHLLECLTASLCSANREQQWLTLFRKWSPPSELMTLQNTEVPQSPFKISSTNTPQAYRLLLKCIFQSVHLEPLTAADTLALQSWLSVTICVKSVVIWDSSYCQVISVTLCHLLLLHRHFTHCVNTKHLNNLNELDSLPRDPDSL